jgi:exopolysaccharide production protein ExoY
VFYSFLFLEHAMTPARTPAAPLPEDYPVERLPENYLNWPYLVPSPHEGVYSWQYLYAKRVFDLIGAAVMICLFAMPGLLIALAILFTCPGPLFYREERIGRKGVPFRIWKFRTMLCKSDLQVVHTFDTSDRNALQWRMHKTSHDPRITPIGRFLRQWSLDELPQVFNIFVGEMSLVGPRPIVRAELPAYGKQIRFYLMAKPGLSGLWQVSGRSAVDYTERTRLDATYVRHWSISSDIGILLRTIPAVLGRVGAW